MPAHPQQWAAQQNHNANVQIPGYLLSPLERDVEDISQEHRGVHKRGTGNEQHTANRQEEIAQAVKKP